MATQSALAYTENAEHFAPEEREQLILEHLPQVRWIATRIHERLPDNTSLGGPDLHRDYRPDQRD